MLPLKRQYSPAWGPTVRGSRESWLLFEIICPTYFVCKFLHRSMCTVSAGLRVGRPPNLLLIRPQKRLNPVPLERFCSAMYEESSSPPVTSCRTLLPQDLPGLRAKACLSLHQWSLATQILTECSYVTDLLRFYLPAVITCSCKPCQVAQWYFRAVREGKWHRKLEHIHRSTHAVTQQPAVPAPHHSILLATTWVRNLQIPSRNWKANGYPRCRDPGKKLKVVNLFKIPSLEPESYQCSQWPEIGTE